MDKAKYLALAPHRKALYEVVFTGTIGGLADEHFAALEGRHPGPGEDLSRCQRLLAPEKTFKYYQQQFHLIAASQVLVKYRRDHSLDPSQGLLSFVDDYIPCTSGQGCRHPIGSFAIRLKVAGGKVVDKRVEKRDYGWCDFSKSCVTTEQIDQEYRCRNFGNPSFNLFDVTSKLENITLATILPDGEHTIWFQIGTDNFLKNNSVVEAEAE